MRAVDPSDPSRIVGFGGARALSDDIVRIHVAYEESFADRTTAYRRVDLNSAQRSRDRGHLLRQRRDQRLEHRLEPGEARGRRLTGRNVRREQHRARAVQPLPRPSRDRDDSRPARRRDDVGVDIDGDTADTVDQPGELLLGQRQRAIDAYLAQHLAQRRPREVRAVGEGEHPAELLSAEAAHVAQQPRRDQHL